MSFISYALKGSFATFDKKLDKVSKDTGIKKGTLYIKFLHCLLKIGCGYSDFLNYKLYQKTDKEIKEYATIKSQDKFYEIVSPSAYKTDFTVKSNFLKLFSKYIYRDSFYNGTLKELESFLERNPKFMYKPDNSLGGDRVTSMLISDIKDIKAFYNEITNNDILLEGYVIQHPEMAKFAENSVNTLRVMTFGYKGNSKILYVIMRIGNGKASVDNFHQGGMGVIVDVETGKVISNAIDKDNNEYECHPLTGYKFKGFQVPNWDIVKKTCLEAALQSEHIHCIGWDVAVTENGCTFIEGNRRPGFDLPQVLYNRGRKDVMEYCLNEINKIEGTNYRI